MVPIHPGTGHVDTTVGKKWNSSTLDVTLTVTTHRVVVWKKDPQSAQTQARYLHLSHMLQCSAENQMFKAPKILLNTYAGDFLLVFRGKEASRDRDDILSFLHKALQRQEWEAKARLETKQKHAQSLTARKVGVDAILSKNKIKHQQAAKLTDSAFDGDAETLLKEAAELVSVIHKYVATLDRQKETSGDEDTGKLVDMLQDMGMTSALSKSSFRGTTDAYYEQLSRELTDFLRTKLKKAGGLLTLTDTYCMYNRARGSNLVSPDDLVKAVDCMTKLQLGMSKRIFPSGLIVIQDDSFDDVRMAERLQQLAEQGVTEMDAGRALGISILLAHEQVLAAERMGYLVRDETLETIRFFPNKFV